MQVNGAGDLEVIIATGARCFNIPETADKHELTNVARRTARLQRRVTRRRRQRKAAIRRMLTEAGLPLPQADRPGTPAGRVWKDRVRGLTERLQPEEWSRVLIHLAGHRGFKSLSKRERADNKAEQGRMLSAIDRLDQRLAGGTVAEILASEPRQRNKLGEYTYTVLRERVAAETEKLFASQRRLGSGFASAAFERSFIETAFSQRPVAIASDRIGLCRFEVGEKRSPKQAPSFETFRFWQRIVHLDVVGPGRKARRLTPDERDRAAALVAAKSEITFKDLRRQIALPEEWRFAGLSGESDLKKAERRKFADFSGSRRLHDALGGLRFHALLDQSPQFLDETMAAIVEIPDDDLLRGKLHEIGLEPDDLYRILQQIDRFAGLKGRAHISARACRRLLPHLRSGLDYTAACTAAGYDPQKLQGGIEDITNPVVRKVLREALRQTEIIIARHGMPDRIHVELAREVGKSPEERAEIEKAGRKRGDEKQAHRKHFESLLGRAPNAEELLRFELWCSQKHVCPYSGEYIPSEQLVATDNSVQVDHILPYGRSGDDGFHNKVLCFAKQNQDKRGRTPFEWFGDDEERWRRFETSIGLLDLHKEKRRKLTMRTFAARQDEYLKRHLHDTRWITRALAMELGRRWPELLSRKDSERRIYTRPGTITALVRRGLGLDRAKRDGSLGDRDHALDALVTAWTSEKILQALTVKMQLLESQARYAHVPELIADPQQKERLRQAILDAASRVFVSRPEVRKTTGPAHKETLYAFRDEGDGTKRRILRVGVDKLKRDDLERLVGGERARPLREAAIRWLDAAKAAGIRPDKLAKFAAEHPLHMPTRNGEPGPVVRSLRVFEKSRTLSGLVLKRGDGEAHADLESMVRLDIFSNGKKRLLVPIYVWEMATLPAPPMKAIKGNTPYSKWPLVDHSYEFCFSLFPGSLVSWIDREGICNFGYYRSANRNNGAIMVSPPHDSRSEKQIQISPMTLGSFRKLQVNRFGEYFVVAKEVRTWRGGVCI